MWSSVAASGFGDRIVQLAGWQLTGIDLPDSEPARITAGITFFFMLPYVIFGLIGGWLADTLPRKWLMLFCDETRALILLLAFIILPVTVTGAIPGDHHWKVYMIVFATGTLAAIFNPAKSAVIPQIVKTPQLQAANAIVLGIAVIASMIGFKVGDWIIEHQSVRKGLLYAFMCFSISGLFFAFLKVRNRPTTSMDNRSEGQIKRLIQAARYIRRHRSVLLLIVQSVAFWAAAHLFLNAIGVLCNQNYGIERTELRSKIAEMYMVIGFGMLASAFWVAWISTRRESTWLALSSLLMAGVFMFLLAINRSYAVGLALGFAAGFFGNTAMIVVIALTQSITPNYIRGRVFGVRDIVITITAVVVDFTIWRLPGSNVWIIPTLFATAILLAGSSAVGLTLELTRGPMPNRAANLFWRLVRIYVLVWHRLRWIDRHHIPSDGPVILASNHTTGLDPFLMQAACLRRIRWLMLTDYRSRWATPLWYAIEPITLDRTANNLSRIREVVQVLGEGQLVGLFPEGSLQRTLRDLKPFQPGLSMIAQRAHASIVPTWISGTPKRHHMIWHFLQPSCCTIRFGKPFQPDPTMKHDQVMEELRKRMIDLSNDDKGNKSSEGE